jgi:PhnB protein
MRRPASSIPSSFVCRRKKAWPESIGPPDAGPAGTPSLPENRAMQLIPYLSFDGTCRDAFAFYAKALGGTIAYQMTYGESPMCDEMPADSRDRIMHAQLEADGATLMGADGPPPHDRNGSTCINVMVDSIEEAERVFAALLEGGEAQMPLQETFWAHRWGTLTDRYGKPWMVNCMKPEPA